MYNRDDITASTDRATDGRVTFAEHVLQHDASTAAGSTVASEDEFGSELPSDDDDDDADADARGAAAAASPLPGGASALLPAHQQLQHIDDPLANVPVDPDDNREVWVLLPGQTDETAVDHHALTHQRALAPAAPETAGAGHVDYNPNAQRMLR